MSWLHHYWSGHLHQKSVIIGILIEGFVCSLEIICFNVIKFPFGEPQWPTLLIIHKLQYDDNYTPKGEIVWPMDFLVPLLSSLGAILTFAMDWGAWRCVFLCVPKNWKVIQFESFISSCLWSWSALWSCMHPMIEQPYIHSFILWTLGKCMTVIDFWSDVAYICGNMLIAPLGLMLYHWPNVISLMAIA